MQGCRHAASGPVVREERIGDGQNTVEYQRGEGERKTDTKDTGPRPRDELGFYAGRGQDDLAPVDITGPCSAVSAAGRRVRARTVEARQTVAGVIRNRARPLQRGHRHRTVAGPAMHVALEGSDDVRRGGFAPRALVRIPPRAWSRRRRHPKASESVPLTAIPVTFV